jgi:hypothetical protein
MEERERYSFILARTPHEDDKNKYMSQISLQQMGGLFAKE